MFKHLTKKRASGFTIIEVMIVLAIAGLIMVVVLVAVPQLQRNQRNSATRAVADRVMTELQNYATNNNGSYPATATNQTSFCGRYLQRKDGTTDNCTSVTATTTAASFINDPRTGTPMPVNFSATTTVAADAGANSGQARPIVVHIGGTSGYKCNGESVEVGSGARQIALTIFLEGGAIVCRDNQ